MGQDVVEAGASLLEAGIDQLLAAPLTMLDSGHVGELLSRVETARRRLDAIAVRVDAAAEERRRCGDYADCSLTDLLMGRLQLDAREARRRARRAEDLGLRTTLYGEVLAPVLPTTAAALAAGEISAEHADVVARYSAKVDDLATVTATIADDAAEVVERLLVDASRDDPPKLVARLGETLLCRLDPDGAEPADARVDRLRGFGLLKHPDGSSTPQGRWDPELTAMCEAVMEPLAAPRPDPEGGDDRRSAPQRRHDAMRDVFGRLIRGDLAPAGGTPVTLLVRVTADQVPAHALSSLAEVEWDGPPDHVERGRRQIATLADGARDDDIAHGGGVGFSAGGGLLTMTRMLPGLCEAEVDIAVMSAEGGVLAFGRSRRLASKAQRLALAARDGGCCFPGCTRPPAWCEAHHVREWQRGGWTDLDNLCLVCPYHHRHFERLGWSVRMRRGVPEWLPPPWIDPEQRPRRNTTRRLADYDFGASLSRRGDDPALSRGGDGGSPPP